MRLIRAVKTYIEISNDEHFLKSRNVRQKIIDQSEEQRCDGACSVDNQRRQVTASELETGRDELE